VSIAYGRGVSTSTRLRVLAATVGLVAPALSLSVGLASDAGSAAPAAAHRQVPAQRYVTAVVDKKEVTKGKKVTISGAVDAPDAPACAIGVVLSVERSTSGAIYKLVGTVTTDGAGAYSVKEKVKKKSRFRVSAPATDACSSVQSPPRTVKIKQP
jgi:hypothetical protein